MYDDEEYDPDEMREEAKAAVWAIGILIAIAAAAYYYREKLKL